MSSPRQRTIDRSKAGFTLIELLVVVFIIAITMTGITFAFGAATKAELRASCMRIASAAHFSYARAVSQGQTVRIVLDFDQNQIAIEQAEGTVTLARAADERRRATEEAGHGHTDSAAVDPWAAARTRLQNVLHPTFGASPFGCIRGTNDQCASTYRAKSIGGGIRFVKLFVPHEPLPREHGQGGIYFFPMGMTERAVVQLADRADHIFSVAIHPLTGDARIYNTPYVPETLTDTSTDADRSDVEDDSS